jgi:hypothetical protein
MSKMGLHDPFGHFKHKLWPKEKSGVKLSIWFPTTKSRITPISLHANGVPHNRKAFNKCYNFALDLMLIGSLHTKLWAPKVAKVPTLGISGLPLGSLGTKWHLGADPMARHKVYYKGEGDGFPQVWAMVSLVNLCLPMVCPCTKVFQLCTNQLVVWFVQVHVSNWIACQSS